MYHRPMLGRVVWGLGSILLVSSSNTFAADFTSSVSPKEGWKLAADAKDVLIYSRAHADSNLKEFKAIGSIDAPAYAVHAVIDDFENYPKFMSRSPRIRAINVSQTGLRMRSPMILLFNKYSSLWITTRKTSAEIANFRDIVNAKKTMIVLLRRLPTIGTSPQRKVTAMSSGACGI